MHRIASVEKRITVSLFCALCVLCGQDRGTGEPINRSAAARSASSGQAPRPNIVFIMADDLGYGDLGCYGAPDIATPHLDRLAADGVRFTDFYANAPICSPTRAAFLTARYQSRIDLDDALVYQETTGRGLPPDGLTIADALKGAGYATALSGKWHLGYEPAQHPNEQGFERFFGLLGGNHHYFEHMDRIGVHDLFLDKDPVHHEGGYSTDLITFQAIGFLNENFTNPNEPRAPPTRVKEVFDKPVPTKPNKPFFLYLAYGAPHFPWQGPGDRDRVVKPRHESWQQGDRATYAAMVESMDTGIGHVLDTIDRLGLRDDTLVVFTSDNGGHTYSRNAPFQEGKATLWEGGLRVPCVARFPGRIPAGIETIQPAITMDWSAAILRLAGIGAFPGGEDGIDLLPLLTGESAPVERTFYWRRVPGPVRGKVDEHRAVRKGNWKLLEFADGRRYLFDLANDPGEVNDLSAALPGRVRELSDALAAWEKSVLP